MTKQEWKIGECLDIMKEYPDNHFDLILTDPPYGIDICSTGSVGGAMVVILIIKQPTIIFKSGTKNGLTEVILMKC